MGLGDKIFKWLQSIADELYTGRLWRSAADAWQSVFDWVTGHKPPDVNGIFDWILLTTNPILFYYKSLAGPTAQTEIGEFAKQFAQDHKDALTDPKAYLSDLAHKINTDPQLLGASEALGSLIWELIIDPLEASLAQEMYDPKLFTSQFQGKLSALTLAGRALSLSSEIAGLGQVHEVGAAVTDIFRNLGTDYFGVQAVLPLFSDVVQERGRRFFGAKYRPRRWEVPDLLNLLALNQIGADDFRTQMREHGYREADIDLAVSLSQQRVAVGDLINAYAIGEITADDAIARIRQKGYRLEDAQLLIEFQDAQRVHDNREAIVQNAKTTFVNQLLDEGQFRSIMAAARYTQERIDLEVALDKLTIGQEQKRLRVTQIKKLYDDGVLQEPEARSYLRNMLLGDATITLIIESWKLEGQPAAAKLNNGTISEAYVAGVLDRATASRKLHDLGWGDGDTEILLKIADEKIAAKQRAAKKAQVRPLSIAEIETAYKQGVIAEADAADRLKAIGLEPGDVAIVIDTWKTQTGGKSMTVGPSGIIGAYKVGVLDRVTAAARLVDLGLSADDTELELKVADTEIAKAQATTTSTATSSPTVPVIHAAYMQNIMDEAGARSALAAIGFEDPILGLLLSTWSSAKAAVPVRLSASTLLSAYAVGLVTRDATKARLVAEGYNSDDAELTIALAERNFARANPQPAGAAIIESYDAGIISLDEGVKQLVSIGYDENEANFLLRAYALRATVKTKELTEAQVVKLVKVGYFTTDDALARLVRMGYDEPTAELVLTAELTPVPKATAGA